ncbi:XRE family transcriptional regulator [Brevundimonas sp. BAL450]|nr:XRE family transcriptional regulator [Brevundimonas sp. BAL450]
MNMAQRSYEHFEAGAGRVNLERIHRFAEATDSDPYAILASLALGSPEFALRCADNKLMTIVMVALQDFDRDHGALAASLDARTLINAFDRLFKDLGELAVQRDQDARAWLASGADRLVKPVGPEEA